MGGLFWSRPLKAQVLYWQDEFGVWLWPWSFWRGKDFGLSARTSPLFCIRYCQGHGVIWDNVLDDDILFRCTERDQAARSRWSSCVKLTGETRGRRESRLRGLWADVTPLEPAALLFLSAELSEGDCFVKKVILEQRRERLILSQWKHELFRKFALWLALHAPDGRRDSFMLGRLRRRWAELELPRLLLLNFFRVNSSPNTSDLYIHYMDKSTGTPPSLEEKKALPNCSNKKNNVLINCISTSVATVLKCMKWL